MIPLLPSLNMDSNQNKELLLWNENSADFTEWNSLDDLLPIHDLPDEEMAPTESIVYNDLFSFVDDDLSLCMPAQGEEWTKDLFSSGVWSYQSSSKIKLEENSEQNGEAESALKVEESIQGAHCGQPAELEVGGDAHTKERVVPRRARGKRCRPSSVRSWSPLQGEEEGGRSCRHCLTKETPQWRKGPMGPNTLCNACGVKFRRGKLVPEYRPAKSPTFDPSVHSNCNKKLLEMRAACAQDSCLG